MSPQDSWVADAVAQLAIGATGGLVAYLLARRQFISERRWERLYDLYCELFAELNEVESVLGCLRDAVKVGDRARNTDLAFSKAERFEEGLSNLSRFQERLLLLGADGAYVRCQTLLPSLRGFDPHKVTGGVRDIDVTEVLGEIERITQLVHDENYEIAMLARYDLRVGYFQRTTRIAKAMLKRGQSPNKSLERTRER